MEIRRRVLLMTDFLMLLHFITIPAILTLQTGYVNDFTLDREVLIPFITFALLGCIAVILSILLYVAAFKLSSQCVIIWGVFMIIIWLVLFGLIVSHYLFRDEYAEDIPEKNYIYTHSGRYYFKKNSADRIKVNKYSKRTIENLNTEVLIILELWLFYWLLLMFEAYIFYTKLIRFRDNPGLYDQPDLPGMIRVLSETFINLNAYHGRGSIPVGVEALEEKADGANCVGCNLPVKRVAFDEPE